jgi:uncharacterized membrane protein
VETHFRTIIKALSWRIIATLVTFTVSWIVTGELTFAAEIGIADAIIKICAYYIHERTWMRVAFGTLQRPEYEI